MGVKSSTLHAKGKGCPDCGALLYSPNPKDPGHKKCWRCGYDSVVADREKALEDAKCAPPTT